jgi:hypothetical protein
VAASAVADRWWDVAQRLSLGNDAVDVDRIRCRSLVTASCGLAGSSEATCARSFALAREISQHFVRRTEEA